MGYCLEIIQPEHRTERRSQRTEDKGTRLLYTCSDIYYNTNTYKQITRVSHTIPAVTQFGSVVSGKLKHSEHSWWEEFKNQLTTYHLIIKLSSTDIDICIRPRLSVNVHVA